MGGSLLESRRKNLRMQAYRKDTDDLAELAKELSCLNENMLFRSHEDSRKFREYYKSKSWAETEDGDEFLIICIDAVK